MPASGVHESRPERAEIGGVDFAWIDESARRGPDPDPAGEPPPLVLLHGFTGHRDDFVAVAPTLAAHRRVIVPDLRGHGDSDSKSGASGWSLEQLVSDLALLLDHLGIDRCDLLGHSMGGMVAQRFALAHPARVRSLVLMSTAPEVPAGLSREGFEKAAAIAEAKGVDRLQALAERAGRAMASPVIAKWGERYWAHHRRRVGAMTPESYRGIGSALFDGGSLVSRLREIDQPTLVLVGEHDRDWLPGADLFEQNLPDVRRITLAGAEHHPHQESPIEWRAARAGHLARVDSESGDPSGTSERERARERNPT